MPPRVITAVGPLPPPVTGRSVATENVIVHLQRTADCKVHDVGLGTDNAQARSLSSVARKAWRYARAVLSCVMQPDGSVYLVASGGPWLVCEIALALGARLRDRRLLIHHHNWSCIASRTPLMSLLLRVAGQDATHIVLCARMRSRLRASYGPTVRVEVVSNLSLIAGSEAAPTTARPHLPIDASTTPRDRSLKLGMLGNLTMEKGVGRALAVHEKLLTNGYGSHITLAGPIVDGRVEAAVQRVQRRWPGTLELLGFVDRASRTDFLASCDILLFPSEYRNESEPLAVLESRLSGVTVVASDVGCLPEAVGSAGVSLQLDGWVEAAVAFIVERTPAFLAARRDSIGAEARTSAQVANMRLSDVLSSSGRR